MIDVCLLLEGTYPYVAGGVSTWVHQLVSAMKDIHFAVVFIAPHADLTRTMKYEVPGHVLSVREIYLHDYDLSKNRARAPKDEDFRRLRRFYEDLARGSYERFTETIRLFLGGESCFDLNNIFTSRAVWNLLTEFYDQIAKDISFVDFFWTWRSTHLPLVQLFKSEIPEARIYHSISTGYAGALGAAARVLYPRSKYFLTEHGIYSHERVLEITQANWIYEMEHSRFRAESDLSFFKKWWIALFKVLGQISYTHADRIFTLYEGNRIRQVLEGASADKVTIIPNGIDVKDYLSLARERRARPQVGFIGRVVSIKDVKTFIYAARSVLSSIPDAQFYVIGPTDEEEDYFEECKKLVEDLGLESSLTFTGRVKIQDYYRFLDVVVLTSVSEAQPYVILEANILGVPVVATDVGNCREMLEGQDAEDRCLGPSGLVTEVSNPEATAAAVVRLLTDKDFYAQCAAAGQKRVKTYYDQDDLLSRYLNIYEQNL